MYTLFSLRGKQAVITGAATGIGKEMALLFAQRGAKVFLLDLNEEAVLKTSSEINREVNNPNSTVGMKCDVTSNKQVRSCFQRVLRHGRLDILCNNAGIGHVGNILTTEESDLTRVMDVNITGVFFCAKEAIRIMTLDNRGGVILNTGSCASVRPMKDRVAYATSKGAVLRMSTALATDHVTQGIRVNTICPGRVHTTFVDNFIRKNYPGKEEEMFRMLSEYMPQGRMAKPKEVAALALYLCSDEARFVTGATFSIDGGIKGVDHPKLYNSSNPPHPAIMPIASML